ncbi:MAG: hypothetical protein GY937_15930 [bacterium]|nr:hypothetical protein [bacterium]
MKIVRVQHEEPLRLGVFHAADGNDGALDIPLVNDWLQLGLEVRHIPSLKEQTEFFFALRNLRRDLERRDLVEAWFFLHKPPGLRLRFKADGPPEALIETLLLAQGQWKWSWLGARVFDSYFEQRELLSGAFQDDVNRLLTAASDAYMEALISGSRCTAGRWSEFSIAFLDCHLNDRWLVWEALGRFARLRGTPLEGASAQRDQPAATLCDPSDFEALLPLLAAPRSAGFEASTTLLQCLNYIYNLWALDLPTQQQILAEAREACRPELTRT